MVADKPGPTPVTIPVEPTLAIVGALLIQVPPVPALVSVMVWPWQTEVGPEIEGTVLFTVTFAVTIQPVGSESLIITVPAAIPLTTPVVGATEPMAGLLLVHRPVVPPVLERVVVWPVHIFLAPVMAGIR
jgi:hypothetical protein